MEIEKIKQKDLINRNLNNLVLKILRIWINKMFFNFLNQDRKNDIYIVFIKNTNKMILKYIILFLVIFYYFIFNLA